MNDPKHQDERWNELADLLGLPPEKPAARKDTPIGPMSPRKDEGRPTGRVEPEERQPAPRVEEVAPRPAPAAEETPVQWESEFDDDADTPIDDAGADAEESMEAEEGAVDSQAPAEGAAPVTAGDEDKPKRGRRRRRRGRRRGGEDRPEGEKREGEKREGEKREGEAPRAAESRPEKAASPARPPRPQREQEPDRGGRGRRGGRREEEDPRRSRAPAPVRVAQEDAFEEDRDEATVTEARPLAMEDTDFSDWTVPSWQDLIASLYRPDR